MRKNTWVFHPCSWPSMCSSQHNQNIYCTVQCLQNKKESQEKKKTILSIQQSEHIVGLNLFQRLIS